MNTFYRPDLKAHLTMDANPRTDVRPVMVVHTDPLRRMAMWPTLSRILHTASGAAVAVALLISSSPARALTIDLSFPASTPPGSNTAGGGNLEDISKAAAAHWQDHVRDTFTLKVNVKWGRP